MKIQTSTLYYIFHRASNVDVNEGLHDYGDDLDLELEFHDLDGNANPMTFGQIKAHIFESGDADHILRYPNAFGPQTALQETYPNAIVIVVYGDEYQDGFEIWVLLDCFPLVAERSIIIDAIAEAERWEYQRTGPAVENDSDLP